jgi:hypothetical protein
LVDVKLKSVRNNKYPKKPRQIVPRQRKINLAFISFQLNIQSPMEAPVAIPPATAPVYNHPAVAHPIGPVGTRATIATRPTTPRAPVKQPGSDPPLTISICSILNSFIILLFKVRNLI